MQNLIFPVKRADHFMYPEAMFRTRSRPGHGGIDLTPCVWNRPEPFYAPEPGRLIIVDTTANKGDQSGKDIMLQGDWTGIRWWGGHLSATTKGLAVGQHVDQGFELGMTGSTGNSSATHLHLEAHFPAINVEINPWPWLWDAPDVDGNTFTLAPTREKALLAYPSLVKDSSKASEVFQEDDMYTQADRNRDDSIYRWLQEVQPKVARIESKVTPIIEALNRIETDGAVVRWATTDEGVGLRRQVADLATGLSTLPGASVSAVTLAEGEAEKIANTVLDAEHRRLAE